jgi:hypothetical protein
MHCPEARIFDAAGPDTQCLKVALRTLLKRLTVVVRIKYEAVI